MNSEILSDLVILSADKNMEFAVKGILSRYNSLGIKRIDPEYYVHPNHDPGCLNKGHLFLKPFANQFDHAIMLFDREGCGNERNSSEELEAIVEKNLSDSGWGNRAAAIVIDPELEMWVWSNSPHVDSILGWKGSTPSLRFFLKRQGFLEEGHIKPTRPKEAMECALRTVHKPRSSSIYRHIAEKVSLLKCADKSFGKFKGILQQWFPNE